MWALILLGIISSNSSSLAIGTPFLTTNNDNSSFCLRNKSNFISYSIPWFILIITILIIPGFYDLKKEFDFINSYINKFYKIIMNPDEGSFRHFPMSLRKSRYSKLNILSKLYTPKYFSLMLTMIILSGTYLI